VLCCVVLCCVVLCCVVLCCVVLCCVCVCGVVSPPPASRISPVCVCICQSCVTEPIQAPYPGKSQPHAVFFPPAQTNQDLSPNRHTHGVNFKNNRAIIASPERNFSLKNFKIKSDCCSLRFANNPAQHTHVHTLFYLYTRFHIIHIHNNIHTRR